MVPRAASSETWLLQYLLLVRLLWIQGTKNKPEMTKTITKRAWQMQETKLWTTKITAGLAENTKHNNTYTTSDEA